ncbi:MAG: histidine kinase [Runella slithyformis]|nr:MAG: histidine kinase [Runella slithyformis]
MNNLINTFLQFHKKQRLLVHLLFWLLVYSFSIVESDFLHDKQALVGILLVAFCRISIAYLVVYAVIPLCVEHKKYLISFVVFLAGNFTIYLIISLIRLKIEPLFGVEVPIFLADATAFYRYFFQNHLWSNLGAAAAMLLVKLLLNQSEIQRKALTLEKQKTEIELKLLKTQLNPHFLFNTLNNIYTLSLLNSPKTSASIARLSEILDYILYRCNASKVPLSHEIKLIENYIELEKLRYDERLRVSFRRNIEKQVEIAPLLLLSLAENAFKHGAAEDAGSPIITIDLSVTAHVLRFEISNSTASVATKSKTQGIGLQNLKQQLALLYPASHSLEIIEKERMFTVILIIETPLLGRPNVSAESL